MKECHDTPPQKDINGVLSLCSLTIWNAPQQSHVSPFFSPAYMILIQACSRMSSPCHPVTRFTLEAPCCTIHKSWLLTYSGDIRRVLGNIGKPGMAFLIPPVDPMIREVKMADWSRIDRDEFDGDMRDCFESTSLHLSFTGAKHSCKSGLLRWTGCGCLSAGDANFTKRWR